jgi:mono/diheme cytochrome c family protein
MKRRLLLGTLLVFVGLAATLVILNLRGEDDIADRAQGAASPTLPGQVARGRYLAQAGDCMACHTARGGVAYAGGVGIDTPFGTVFAPNITPDAETGIGDWSSAHFWRAVHNGRSRDGRLLYPAFPYPNYTKMTREDSDAIHAFLMSLAPVKQPNKPHALRFPYDTTLALAVWRAVYFQPGSYVPDPGRSGDWNRGAYLVQGLGHCNACHSTRNALGASSDTLDLGGGLIPVQNWYAPSLTAPHEAGVSEWEAAHVVDLLKKGVTPQASVLGPMSEVVFRSTQFLDDTDLRAMATYLKALPPTKRKPPAARELRPDDAPLFALGGRLYGDRCASCHGRNGEGVAGVYPALAGNRAVVMDSPVNVVRVVVEGGYAPATSGNPRPYGMPPFATELSGDEIAAVVSYIRGSWGNAAPPVSPLDVARHRGPQVN